MNIGIDMLEIKRVTHMLRYEHTLPRIFTAEELAMGARYTGARKNEYFAGRFAVKEAVIKALGPARDIKLTDIATLAHSSGQPLLRLYGNAEQVVKAAGLMHYHVSISHCMDYAVAMVVLE